MEQEEINEGQWQNMKGLEGRDLMCGKVMKLGASAAWSLTWQWHPKEERLSKRHLENFSQQRVKEGLLIIPSANQVIQFMWNATV